METIRREERKFLHQLSTPLSTIGLLVEMLEADSAALANSQRELRQALAEITALVRKRRQTLTE